jgi:hypothetical protein
MECKEISKFILQNGIKIIRLPRLSESESLNPPKTGPCVLSSLLTGYCQYYNPEKGVCHPHPTLSSEELLRDTLQPFRHPVQNKHK